MFEFYLIIKQIITKYIIIFKIFKKDERSNITQKINGDNKKRMKRAFLSLNIQLEKNLTLTNMSTSKHPGNPDGTNVLFGWRFCNVI
jgi:hypothetical protein